MARIERQKTNRFKRNKRCHQTAKASTIFVIKRYEDTLRGIMTNRTFPRIRNDLFTLIVRPWRENDTYYTKKSREIITTYRLQTVVSKKLVSKLATVRNRIKRRIREAARYALPSVGRVRHDYLFLAGLNVYNVSWKELCVAVENAVGNPKLYKTRNRPDR
ncbi:hypothetical protein C2G38_89706 [Gigaspora rosea]|uniref:Uncharacterized protein n=1 Tax=Gigaspora rosea TaxID=44941 RepID=A0A397UN73_9GLOM|nr:hypothetical protein C2G38_89706 [Gigaspora rosea]